MRYDDNLPEVIELSRELIKASIFITMWGSKKQDHELYLIMYALNKWLNHYEENEKK